MAHDDVEDRSVSLVVFLTDGKPTVGEIDAGRILNNTRAAARGRVCIFTIGIGNDVDFRLLEKLSLENCGLTRRVHEEDDAGSQLIGFVRPSWGGEGGGEAGGGGKGRVGFPGRLRNQSGLPHLHPASAGRDRDP